MLTDNVQYMEHLLTHLNWKSLRYLIICDIILNIKQPISSKEAVSKR